MLLFSIRSPEQSAPDTVPVRYPGADSWHEFQDAISVSFQISCGGQGELKGVHCYPIREGTPSGVLEYSQVMHN